VSEAKIAKPARNVSEQPAQTDPELLAEVGLETEGTRDSLLGARKESRLELRRSIGYSAFAGLVIGLEAWGIVRGEPFFGWLIPVLFTGFAVYFWSRRRRARDHVFSLEEKLGLLEEEREELANRDGSGSGSRLAGGSLEDWDGQGIA
jgi:hypothetical protein